jgi:hypothetical protein
VKREGDRKCIQAEEIQDLQAISTRSSTKLLDLPCNRGTRAVRTPHSLSFRTISELGMDSPLITPALRPRHQTSAASVSTPTGRPQGSCSNGNT